MHFPKIKRLTRNCDALLKDMNSPARVLSHCDFYETTLECETATARLRGDIKQIAAAE